MGWPKTHQNRKILKPQSFTTETTPRKSTTKHSIGYNPKITNYQESTSNPIFNHQHTHNRFLPPKHDKSKQLETQTGSNKQTQRERPIRTSNQTAKEEDFTLRIFLENPPEIASLDRRRTRRKTHMEDWLSGPFGLRVSLGCSGHRVTGSLSRVISGSRPH